MSAWAYLSVCRDADANVDTPTMAGPNSICN